MTNQEKKVWLKSYRDLDSAINQKLEEASRLQSLATKMTQVMSGMPHGGNSAKDDAYVKLIDLKNEINSDTDRYIDLRKDIENAILSVDDMTLQNVLRYRYIDGMTWEQISVHMNYEYWYVVKDLHSKALTNCKYPKKPQC